MSLLVTLGPGRLAYRLLSYKQHSTHVVPFTVSRQTDRHVAFFSV